MISIVIPLYNKEETIYSTISSVLNQTYEDFEIVIIDDGSTDNSLGIVKTFNDKRISVFTKKNEGVSSARNYGFGKTNNNYVALLDGDDIWHENFLYEMHKMLVDYPNASLYGSAYSFINSDNFELIIDYSLPKTFKGYIENYFAVASQNILFTSSSVIINKESFYSVGGFDIQLKKGEDIDLWIKLALNFPVAYINKPLVEYKLNATNRTMNGIALKQYSLVNNLQRYSIYEKENSDFKYFLDNWRISHIKNYLEGNRKEVHEIDSLLASINFSKFPIFWHIIYHLPKTLRVPLFKSRKMIHNNIKNMIKWLRQEK